MTAEIAMFACHACNRHVRPTESTCPFCAAPIETTADAVDQACARVGVAGLEKFALEIGLSVLTVGAFAMPACTDDDGDGTTMMMTMDPSASEYGGPTGGFEEGDGDPGDGDPTGDGDGDPSGDGDGDPTADGDGDPTGDGDGDGDTGA